MGAFEFGLGAPDGGPGYWDGGSQRDAGATGSKSSGCACSMFPSDPGLGLLAPALLVGLWLGAKRRRNRGHS
jgi:MYXO-CTERM domain-containing protein